MQIILNKICNMLFLRCVFFTIKYFFCYSMLFVVVVLLRSYTWIPRVATLQNLTDGEMPTMCIASPFRAQERHTSTDVEMPIGRDSSSFRAQERKLLLVTEASCYREKEFLRLILLYYLLEY